MPGPPLLHTLAENWWLVLLRGIAALVLGVLAFVWPGITLVSLILLWGIYALADGLFAMWAAVAGRSGGIVPRWWLAIVGIAGVLAGILTFVLAGSHGANSASADCWLGHRDRRDADMGRHPAAQRKLKASGC